MIGVTDGPHTDTARAAALADSLRSGAPGATAELVAAPAAAVFEFILYRVGHRRDVAEDLAQDTLLTALDRIASFDGRSALRTWLFGIAKNKVRESLRARRARALSDVVVDADDEILATLGRIEEEPLPEDVLEREETRAFVGATLSSLSDAHREALTERYVVGRSVPETARRQGRSVKAAESTLHRAKRAFRDVFAILSEQAGLAPEGGAGPGHGGGLRRGGTG